MDDWVSESGMAVLDPASVKALSTRSDVKGAVQLTSHVAAMAATAMGLAATWGTWWAVPIFVLHGYLINCLFATQHECNHWTAFETRWVNDTVNRVTGFVLLYPARWERWLHFAHHRHTQDPEKDPELLMRPRYRLGNYLFVLSGVGYWYGRARTTLRVAAGRIPPYVYWLSAEQRRYVVHEARWHLVGYALVAAASAVFESWLAASYWLAPMLISKPLHELQGLSRHLGLSRVPDTLRNTRTLEVPAIVRWMLWNMPYHTVHHTFPAIPFHRLPEAHREVETRLGHPLPSAGYLQFQREIIRALSRGSESEFQLPIAATSRRASRRRWPSPHLGEPPAAS